MVIDEIKQKRLIFTVSTGRSGTAFVEWILGFVNGIDSQHEPEPCYHHVLRQVQEDPGRAKTFLLTEKFPAIAARKGNIYFESSHLFCKGFAEVCLELGVVPDLIIHKRDNRKVALSMLRGGTVPAVDQKANIFYLRPDDPGVMTLPGWERMNYYQLCYWYTLEIDRRAVVYEQLFKEHGARVVHTTLDSLKTISGFNALIRSLSLPRPGFVGWYKFLRHRGFSMNAQIRKEAAHPIPKNLDVLEAEVESRVNNNIVNS